MDQVEGLNDRVYIYGRGIIVLSVCVRNDTTDEEATRIVNEMDPSGTHNGWMISEAPTFATGQPNPCPCDQGWPRRHMLFEC